jgi:hypothetical protein
MFFEYFVGIPQQWEQVGIGERTKGKVTEASKQSLMKNGRSP